MICIVGEKCNEKVSQIPFHPRSQSCKRLKSIGMYWDSATNIEGMDIDRLRAHLERRYHKIVLVGGKAAAAFGFENVAPLSKPNCRYYVMPHPSGLNRWWNDKNNIAEAIRFLKEHELSER